MLIIFQAGALDKLEGFASFHGPDFYGLPRNKVCLLVEKKRNWGSEVRESKGWGIRDQTFVCACACADLNVGAQAGGKPAVNRQNPVEACKAAQQGKEHDSRGACIRACTLQPGCPWHNGNGHSYSRPCGFRLFWGGECKGGLIPRIVSACAGLHLDLGKEGPEPINTVV